MPHVTFISANGDRYPVDVKPGTNLMRAAQDHGIDAIVGECGGNMVCATCHVFVAQEFAHALPAPTRQELEMLEFAVAPRRPTSRLSCQIVADASIEGLVLEIADPQT